MLLLIYSNELAKCFEEKIICPNRNIYKSDENASSCFYIITKGEVVTENGHLKEKDTFGEENLFKNDNEPNNNKMKIYSENFVNVYRLNYEIFKTKILQINGEIEIKERIRFVEKIPFFEMLTSSQTNNIIRNMYKRIYKPQEIITHEGSSTNSLFFIFSGKVQCFKYNDYIRELSDHEMLGEYAFLFDTTRSATLIAKTHTICYQICIYVLIKYLGEENYKQILLRSIIKEAFKRSKYLKLFYEEHYLNLLTTYSSFKTYEEKEIIVQKSAQLNKIILIITGNFIKTTTEDDDDNEQLNDNDDDKDSNDNYIENKNIIVRRFQVYYGILSNKEQINDIIAHSQCTTIEFEWNENISQAILPGFSDVSNFSNALPLLTRLYNIKRMDLLKTSDESKYIEINSLIQKEVYQDKEIIIKENTQGNKLYFIQKGKVSVYIDNTFVRELTNGSIFGEVSLLNNITTTATVEAHNKVTLYSLSKEHFNTIIDDKMKRYFQMKTLLYSVSSKSIKDFYFCKHLGRGRFGKVSLVHDNKHLYAIKVINRTQAEKNKLLFKYFIQEKNILLQLEHPFIMKLFRTLKTEKYLFYLIEYINGFGMGTLIGTVQPNSIKFYLANIFIILDYLNSKGICHRDLKPDNLMIDSNTGYLKLIDFGAAVKFNEINITNTLTGTPNYMAPEVLKGKGYGFSCDYWSVGVIAFELFYNYYPFGNEANEPIEVYEEIINKELKFPNDNNILMNELIRCLLEKETYKRICCLKQVKETEMFRDFKWDDIISMEMQSPVIEENTFDNNTINELKEYAQKYFDVIDKEDIRIEGTESNISYESSLETNEQQLLKNNWTYNF